MSDRIRLRGLEVRGRIGVTDEERAVPQTLIIDLDIEADLRKAGRTDDLAHTVDYSKVADEIERLVAAEEMKLLERVAERIVEQISLLLGVERVTVEVSKKASMPQKHNRVSVRLERP